MDISFICLNKVFPGIWQFSRRYLARQKTAWKIVSSPWKEPLPWDCNILFFLVMFL